MSEPRKLIDTKGDVERACRLDPRGERDYLAYAAHNLKGAIDKREDAPCSSAEHEMAARVALNMERVPTYPEIVEAWKTHGEPSVPLSAIRALVQQCKADAIAHRREAETIRCKSPESLRLATSCENVLAGVHEWFAYQLAVLCPVPPEDQA